MIHVIRLYFVAPRNAQAFITALRDGGPWCESIRRLCPGLIGTDLLRNRTVPSVFVSIEFWVSEDAYCAAWNSHATSVLAKFLKNLGVACVDLGAFSFPPQDDSKNSGIRHA